MRPTVAVMCWHGSYQLGVRVSGELSVLSLYLPDQNRWMLLCQRRSVCESTEGFKKASVINQCILTRSLCCLAEEKYKDHLFILKNYSRFFLSLSLFSFGKFMHTALRNWLSCLFRFPSVFGLQDVEVLLHSSLSAVELWQQSASECRQSNTRLFTALHSTSIVHHSCRNLQYIQKPN